MLLSVASISVFSRPDWRAEATALARLIGCIEPSALSKLSICPNWPTSSEMTDSIDRQVMMRAICAASDSLRVLKSKFLSVKASTLSMTSARPNSWTASLR